MSTWEEQLSGVHYKLCIYTTTRRPTSTRIQSVNMFSSSTPSHAFSRIDGIDRNSIAIRKVKKKYRQEKLGKLMMSTSPYTGEPEKEDISVQLAKPKNFYTAIDSSPRAESPAESSDFNLDESSTCVEPPAYLLGIELPTSIPQLPSTPSSTRSASPASFSHESSSVSPSRSSSPSLSTRAASPAVALSPATSAAASLNTARSESPVALPSAKSSASSSRPASPTMSTDSNSSIWSAGSSTARSESPPPTLSAIAAASLWSAAIAVPMWNPTLASARNGSFPGARNNVPLSSNWSAASHLLHWNATAPDYSWNATPPSLLWNSLAATSVWDAPLTTNLWNGVSPISLLNGGLPSTSWSGSSPASLRSRAAPISFWNDASMSPTWNAALALSPWTPNMPGSSWSQIAPRLIKSGKSMLNYKSKKPLTLSCYTSDHGVAAVLTRNLEDGTVYQVAVEMRTFLVCERWYSNIDKGVASVLLGIRRCHKYLIGRAFTIVTDQEPLVRIFDPKRPIPNEYSPRYVKAAIALMSYHYDIVYQPVTDIPKFNEPLE